MTNIKKIGWVVITPTLCQGDVMIWSETQDEEDTVVPVVFETIEDAWREIADSIITNLQQFINGERDLEDTDFSTDEYVAQYVQFEDDTIVVSNDDGNPIVETTLQEWRANR